MLIPTAAIEAYTKDDCLYIRNACAKVGLELDDTANYLKTIFPNIEKYTSRADNARPETISKVKKEIPLIKACTKWKGFVEDGVAFCNLLRLFMCILTLSVALVS